MDVSDEAVRARMQDLTDGAKGLTLSNDMERPEKERVDLFYDFVRKKLESGKIKASGVDKELFIEAERLDITSKASLVLAELLFDQNIIAQV